MTEALRPYHALTSNLSNADKPAMCHVAYRSFGKPGCRCLCIANTILARAKTSLFRKIGGRLGGPIRCRLCAPGSNRNLSVLNGDNVRSIRPNMSWNLEYAYGPRSVKRMA